MSLSNDYTQSILNDLIAACVDSEQAFGKAAEEVNDAELCTLFQDYSRLRRQMADLRDEAQTFGGEPTTAGMLTGSVRRGWNTVKSAFTGMDDAAILCECQRVEEAAIGRYRPALDSTIPVDLARLVRRQYNVFVASRERLRSLEKSHAHA